MTPFDLPCQATPTGPLGFSQVMRGQVRTHQALLAFTGDVSPKVRGKSGLTSQHQVRSSHMGVCGNEVFFVLWQNM